MKVRLRKRPRIGATWASIAALAGLCLFVRIGYNQNDFVGHSRAHCAVYGGTGVALAFVKLRAAREFKSEVGYGFDKDGQALLRYLPRYSGAARALIHNTLVVGGVGVANYAVRRFANRYGN